MKHYFPSLVVLCLNTKQVTFRISHSHISSFEKPRMSQATASKFTIVPPGVAGVTYGHLANSLRVLPAAVNTVSLRKEAVFTRRKRPDNLNFR